MKIVHPTRSNAPKEASERHQNSEHKQRTSRRQAERIYVKASVNLLFDSITILSKIELSRRDMPNLSS